MTRFVKMEPSEASIYRWSLMRQGALLRLEDADALAKNASVLSDSANLLSLLGFEILLKLVYEVTNARSPKGSTGMTNFLLHYQMPRKGSILKLATERIGPSALNTSVGNVLKDLSQNFIGLRYPYEKSEGMTERQSRERSEAWLEKGGPMEQADFRYDPEEFAALVYALKRVTEDMANNGWRCEYGQASPQ